ncbi:CPBP family intramembrane glutamic endopeptidase [Haloarcula pelagica]|uniref:CPBP family intramembrane glutamic endopeptidase n=1 Tax=Haloarcula pelagica TaxID=3033389 RepID=UPI0024C3854D|nr:CPBP family intramembrane metalloprotease [Halomicroarcula sp. YJ-61-S]
MPGWAAFVGLTGLLLTALLALARLSQGVADEQSGLPATAEGVPSVEGHADTATPDPVVPRFETPETARRRRWVERRQSTTPEDFSTGALLANVALTQGLFGALLLAGAFYYQIPASAFGVTAAPLSTGLPAVAVGVAAGVGFWLGNEAAASLAAGFDMAFDESVRELLAPDSLTGWVVLLGVILPTIAVVEELLFRAAAIGVPVAGLGAPAWAMALVSSVAFALGHGAQGRVGIVVTGTLGLGLAGLFVVTDSLLAVVVAHYLVNALELVVHEGLGIDRLSL